MVNPFDTILNWSPNFASESSTRFTVQGLEAIRVLEPTTGKVLKLPRLKAVDVPSAERVSETATEERAGV